MNLDKYNTDYREALRFQAEHLDRWKRIIKPEIFEPAAAYAIAANREARTKDEEHRVYRGHNLTNIFFYWPNLPDRFVKQADLGPNPTEDYL